VVIYDFHIFRARICPNKAQSPLIVYADAILAGTITLERFEMIAGWRLQIIEPIRDFELTNFASSDFTNVREPFDMVALCQRFRIFTFEGFNHVSHNNALRD
jgi:hypothetical protein